jgi:peptidoglycan/xylan/chitin deacetylase (PgdA/CDA1 family)
MTRVLLGVDTEADNQWEAASRENIAVRNIAELARLQELCDEYGVRPTYLLTQEVAVDAESKAILKELAATGRSEIGTHHHPWTTPPLVEDHLYPLNLTPEHFHAQLRELTQAVTDVTGERPVSYRAGRNGFAGWQVEILEREGYLIDSSVDPFFNERKKGGPSFAGAPMTPYFVSGENPCRPGPTKLLELPITSALNRQWPQWLQTVYADYTPAYQFRRVLRLLRIARPIWLRPSYSKTQDMLWLAEKLVSTKAPLANIIFHSSELLPGGSPYNVTETDVERFYEALRKLLELLAKRGVQGKTFREFRDEWIARERP